MDTGIIGLGIVIVGAAVLGVLARIFRQPIVLAYLITGILIGYFGLLTHQDQSALATFSDLGIMFLLFLVGLEINYASLRTVGRSSLIIGLGQIVLTFVAGLGLSHLFGFTWLQASYVAAAMTFSSTVIVVKLLSEKRDLNSLYGKITVGVLLIQDFVAILILVILAGVASGGGVSAWAIVRTLIIGIAMFLVMVWLGRRILPTILDRAANSQELLFLVSLAWLFLVAATVRLIGFSIEIGGFLAGIAMANSSEHFQIAHRVRPLRDFFILIFFVILGSSILFSDFRGMLWPIIAFSFFVLIGNPLIMLIIMGAMGYKKRTGFLAGVTAGQISEFSLILVTLGLSMGHLTKPIVSFVTAVGIITILISSYLITHAEKIFRKISRLLSIFERSKVKEEHALEHEFDKPIILIGAHRIGQSIAASLPKEDLLVIEFDPEVVEHLKRQGYEYIFGDVADEEVFERAHIDRARLAISTNPELEDNRLLLAAVRRLHHRPKLILRAESESDAEVLYREGADYVLLPHFTSGQYLGKTIAVDPEMKVLDQLKKRDMAMLRERATFELVEDSI